MLEHGVGVEVGACRLHEHGPLDSSPLKKWLEILRPEGPPDDRVLVGQPRLGLSLEIPEVLMGVDRHRCWLSCLRTGALGLWRPGGSLHASPGG